MKFFSNSAAHPREAARKGQAHDTPSAPDGRGRYYLPDLHLSSADEGGQEAARRGSVQGTSPYRFEPQAPEAERTPVFFLRHFALPQRTYLTQQFDVARIFLFLCAYILFVIASLGLLPATAGQPQGVWERYLNQLTWAGYAAEVFAFMTAIAVVTALKTPAPARFNRTRPLSCRLLFFGRTFFLLAGVLAATQAALLASILLLLIIYGPTGSLASVPWRSLCQLDLSMVTTTALIFSVFVLFAFFPGRWSMPSTLKFFPIFFGLIVGSQAIRASHFLLTMPSAKILFLFPAQGPSWHYAYALVPAGCAAALLLLAERLASRFEI